MRGLMAPIRRSGVKKVLLPEVKDDLSRGVESEENWFEYRLEHDPRFLRRIEQARNSLRAGRGTRLEDIDSE